MKSLHQSLLLAFGAVALAGSAYGQVPASNDKSDANSNYGSGTGALGRTGSSGGTANTASGTSALSSVSSGEENTAAGAFSLAADTTGADNTATGFQALNQNTAGAFNTAAGAQALFFNSTGDYNTGLGYIALYNNNTGQNNTAAGAFALLDNTTGGNNAALGYSALYSNATGGNNTASGFGALYKNQTGSNNIAVGYQAGYNLTTGSNNIDIGSAGVAGENNVIRIGTKGVQKVTLIAGIYNSPLSGSAVVVSSTGRLGVTVSSERFKTGIAPMGSNSNKLNQLRAVSFHLKSEPNGALQYGLIAEEVAKVYPELVIRDASGRIDGVRYDELAPLLLNQAQQQAAEIRDLKEQMAELKALNQAARAALQRVEVKDELIVQR